MGMFDRFFGPPTRDSFARLIITRIRAAGEQRKVRYDAQQFSLRPDGNEVSVMNLSNLYAEYCAAEKSARLKMLVNITRSWFSDRRTLPAQFEDVHPDLLPSVRSRSYYEFAMLQLQIEGARDLNYPQQSLGDHLSVGLVYDLPDCMRTIVAQDLDNWQVNYFEAYEAALTNLRHKEDPVFVSPAQGVYLSATGDNYDASRMVLVDMIRQFEVEGDPVVMVPNRDTLIVTGTRELNGLKVMLARAKQALEEPRPISSLAFRLENDEWVEWLPDLDHPLHAQFALLRLRSFGQQYAEQKELLEKLHGRKGEEVYVAEFSAAQNSITGELHSYCVWSEGVDTLLPKTDQIYFFRPANRQNNDEQTLAHCRWDEVQRIAGAMLELDDIYPERYRVRTFPSEQQLQILSSTP